MIVKVLNEVVIKGINSDDDPDPVERFNYEIFNKYLNDARNRANSISQSNRTDSDIINIINFINSDYYLDEPKKAIESIEQYYKDIIKSLKLYYKDYLKNINDIKKKLKPYDEKFKNIQLVNLKINRRGGKTTMKDYIDYIMSRISWNGKSDKRLTGGSISDRYCLVIYNNDYASDDVNRVEFTNNLTKVKQIVKDFIKSCNDKHNQYINRDKNAGYVNYRNAYRIHILDQVENKEIDPISYRNGELRNL